MKLRRLEKDKAARAFVVHKDINDVSVQARYVELASQYEECWPDKACKTQVNFRRAETPRLALAGTGTETTATISNADTDRSSRERPGPISFVMNLDFKGHRGKKTQSYYRFSILFLQEK